MSATASSSRNATTAPLAAATPLFGWLSARVPRYQLLLAVYGFFFANLVIWYFLMTSRQYPDWVARGFFIWLSVFNLFVISIAWSLMADVFNADQGHRLFGQIAAGASFGGLIGPLLSARM